MTLNIDVAIEIAASPDQIWTYVRDISSHTEWMHDAVAIEFLSDTTEGVGTTFDVKTKVGPLQTTDRMTITRWDDNEVMGVDHEGLFVGRGEFVLEPMGDRTTFRWQEELRFPLRFGGPIGEFCAKPILRFVWNRNLRGLKRRVELGAGMAAPEADAAPGALIGQGRDGDVREFGPGRAIRTSRSGRDLSEDRRVMQYVHDAGFPVPRVHDHPDPTVTVMDRVDGPTMMEDLAAHPWRLRQHAETLASLHQQLRTIEPPPGLRRLGPGQEFLHLDLHPNNVILSDDGPMLIDWSNAAVGSGDLDVALTWVFIKTGPITANAMIKPVLETLRDQFVKAFERAAGEARIRANATAAAELRLLDDNLLASERDEVFRLARQLQDRPLHSRTDDA